MTVTAGLVFGFLGQVLFIIANTVANGLVIVVFMRFERFRQNLFNWYVTSLAAADLGASLDMVHNLLKWYYGRWPLGETGCNVIFVIIYATVYMSAFMITVMSLDRYLCVSKPVKYKMYHKAMKTRKLVGGGLLTMWLLMFVVYSISAFGWVAFTGQQDLDYTFECEMPFYKNLAMNLLWISAQFLIPLVLLSYFNSQVFYKLKRHANLVRDHSLITHSSAASTVDTMEGVSNVSTISGMHSIVKTNGVVHAEQQQGNAAHVVAANSAEKKFEKKRKSVILLALYVCVFLICWIPFSVMLLVDTLCGSCTVSINVYITCVYLIDFNSLLNPLLYTMRTPTFRQDIRALLCR